MEGIGLAGVGAINGCQFVAQIVAQRVCISCCLVERIGTLQA